MCSDHFFVFLLVVKKPDCQESFGCQSGLIFMRTALSNSSAPARSIKPQEPVELGRDVQLGVGVQAFDQFRQCGLFVVLDVLEQ